MTDTLVNRGTGAGGSNTNKTGLSFENITRIEEHLLELKFTKTDKGYYKKIYDDKIIYYASKKQFIKMAEDVLDIKKGELYKQPDEGYIIIIGKDNIYVKILEKKNQNCSGSVFEKLYGCLYVRDVCYKNNIDTKQKTIKIEYAYCMNDWLITLINKDTKQMRDFKYYLKKNNIKVFNGNDEKYFDKIKTWIMN